jgi:hypothetical protein
MTAPSHSRFPSWSARLLQVELLARVAWNVMFVVYLAGHVHAFFAEIVASFLTFTIVDGVLAGVIGLTYAFAAPRQSLWFSPAVDAATRGALVALLRLGPGLATFPVTAVLFIGLVATFAAVDGVVDVVEGFMIRRTYGAGLGGLALMVGGTTSALVGAALFVSSMYGAQLIALLALLSSAHAFAHLGAARRARVLIERIRNGVPLPSLRLALAARP